MQDTADVKAVARGVPSPQPCIIVRESDGEIKDAFLVIEHAPLINKVKVQDILLVLFASFFVFNVHYPEGCCNFFSLLEVFFLDKKIPPRKPRLSALVRDSLQHI